MIGHLGFSYVGLIYLLMLWIPNIIWSNNKPIDYNTAQENRVLLFFERVGQVCVTCSALIFRDFNPAPFSLWSLWLIASFLLMILYEINWVRYFINEHTERNTAASAVFLYRAPVYPSSLFCCWAFTVKLSG